MTHTHSQQGTHARSLTRGARSTPVSFDQCLRLRMGAAGQQLQGNTYGMCLQKHWSTRLDSVLDFRVGNCKNCNTCPSSSDRGDRRNFLFFHASSESGFAKHVGAIGKERELSLHGRVTEAPFLELMTLIVASPLYSQGSSAMAEVRTRGCGCRPSTCSVPFGIAPMLSGGRKPPDDIAENLPPAGMNIESPSRLAMVR